MIFANGIKVDGDSEENLSDMDPGNDNEYNDLLFVMLQIKGIKVIM
jgi:hypothetical protein